MDALQFASDPLLRRGLEMRERLFGMLRRDVGVFHFAVLDGRIEMRDAFLDVCVRLLGFFED